MQAALAEDRLFSIAREASPRLPRRMALAASCFLHIACIALLLPYHGAISTEPPSVEVELLASDDLAPTTDAPADIPEEPVTAMATPEAAAAPPAPAQAEPTPQQQIVEKAPEPPEAETIAPQKLEKIEQAAPAAAPAAPSAAAAIDSEAEAAARRAKAKAFASAVSAELNRRRIYPAAARAKGLAGAAKVSFAIDATGHVARYAILDSTGHAVLDETVGKIMQAMHTPPPPDGAFDAVVTIRFGLR